MEKLRGNCLVAQSGGPTSVINGSAYGIVREFLNCPNSGDYKVFAGLYGIQGVLEKKFLDITKFPENRLEALKHMPSAAFGSCRYKLPDTEETYKKLTDIFTEFNIKYFFYIGGNDSMDAAHKIGRYAASAGIDLAVIGVPKTIDNDLAETDHCPGYGSASKFLCNTALELWFDINSYNKETVMVLETMGRDTGWLAASTGILDELVPGYNQLIYLSEIPFEKEKFLEDVSKKLSKHNRLIVVTAEGLKDKSGEYINTEDNCYAADSFGHKQLGGVGKYLQESIKANITKNVKLTEAGVLQRCALHVVSGTDLEEAVMVGGRALKAALEGNSGVMAAFEREPGEKYVSRVKLVPLEKVSNQVKNVPIQWLNAEGNGVNENMVRYVRPLIAGEAKVFDETGLISNRDVNLFRTL